MNLNKEQKIILANFLLGHCDKILCGQLPPFPNALLGCEPQIRDLIEQSAYALRTKSREEPPKKHMSNISSLIVHNFDLNIYQEILNFCQFIKTIAPANSQPELFALKLALMFNSQKSTLNYLSRYVKTYISDEEEKTLFRASFFVKEYDLRTSTLFLGKDSNCSLLTSLQAEDANKAFVLLSVDNIRLRTNNNDTDILSLLSNTKEKELLIPDFSRRLGQEIVLMLKELESPLPTYKKIHQLKKLYDSVFKISTDNLTLLRNGDFKQYVIDKGVNNKPDISLHTYLDTHLEQKNKLYLAIKELEHKQKALAEEQTKNATAAKKNIVHLFSIAPKDQACAISAKTTKKIIRRAST